MTTLKEFWQTLDPAGKDKLKVLLAPVLLVTTSTVAVYGRGVRDVPKIKQDVLIATIQQHYGVKIVFPNSI